MFAKNQEFELITSCHLKNIIFPKPTWNSLWSLISSSDGINPHTSSMFQIFFFKKRFLRESSKPGHGNLVIITSTVPNGQNQDGQSTNQNFLHCVSSFKGKSYKNLLDTVTRSFISCCFYQLLHQQISFFTTKVFCQCSLTVPYHVFSRLLCCDEAGKNQNESRTNTSIQL